MKDIQSHIDKLRNIINLHNYQYYILNNPLSNDEEFDLLLQKLNILENRYPLLSKTTSPTKRLSPILNNKKGCYPIPIRYHFPMLSLQTIFTPQKLEYFLQNLPKEDRDLNKIEFCCELKIDGVAINLIYKKNRLIFAGTRGNGYYGENITKNIFLIPNIPKYLVFYNTNYILPEYCEIRGEIFIPQKDFYFLKNNAERFNIQHLIYNARNLASGLLKNIYEVCSYKNIVPHQLLKFYAYNFLFDEQKEIRLSNLLNNQWKRLNFLRLMDFAVCKYCILSNTPQEIMLYYQVIKSKIDKIDLDIDGVVIKVNNLKLQNYLGWDTKSPRWALAIKFPPNNHITYLRNIQWKMSRYGVITPIALILPIPIAGATINKINLHNYKIIKKLDLRLNDAIMIYRAGEVIPKIHYVIKSLRDINCPLVKRLHIPSHCSLCKSLLRLDPQNNLFCTGNLLFCKKQFKYTITHLVSKYAFNITDIGYHIISLLIEKQIISTHVDIFYLTEKDLDLLNLCKKRVKSIIKKINLAKIIQFKNFIYSLGIPNLGWLMAKKIALGFNSLDNLFNCDIEELKKQTGLGGKIAYQIFFYIKEKYIRYLVMTLLNVYKLKII